jgi:hypothetical protein
LSADNKLSGVQFYFKEVIDLFHNKINIKVTRAKKQVVLVCFSKLRIKNSLALPA